MKGVAVKGAVTATPSPGLPGAGSSTVGGTAATAAAAAASMPAARAWEEPRSDDESLSLKDAAAAAAAAAMLCEQACGHHRMGSAQLGRLLTQAVQRAAAQAFKVIQGNHKTLKRVDRTQAGQGTLGLSTTQTWVVSSTVKDSGKGTTRHWNMSMAADFGPPVHSPHHAPRGWLRSVGGPQPPQPQRAPAAARCAAAWRHVSHPLREAGRLCMGRVRVFMCATVHAYRLCSVTHVCVCWW